MPTYYDEHADLSIVQDRHAAVLGEGDAALVFAAALRDAGVPVVIGARPGAAVHVPAELAGIETASPSTVVPDADLVVLVDSAPDDLDRLRSDVLPLLEEGAVVVLDPLAVRFGALDVPAALDVVLVQPLAPATVVERELAAGRGVPVVVAVQRDVSGGALELALSYAKATGGTRAGALAATVEAAAETLLFGELAVAGATVHGLVAAAFDILVEAGYPRDLAYLGCVHTLQRAVGLMPAEPVGGPGSVAEYARLVGGARRVDDEMRAGLGRALEHVRSGEAFADFAADRAAGEPELTRLRTAADRHPVISTGRRVRRLLPWIGPSATDARHAR